MDEEKKIADHTVQNTHQTFGELPPFTCFRYNGRLYRKSGKKTAIPLGGPDRVLNGRKAVPFKADLIIDN